MPRTIDGYAPLYEDVSDGIKLLKAQLDMLGDIISDTKDDLEKFVKDLHDAISS